jgi:hypothetical protein
MFRQDYNIREVIFEMLINIGGGGGGGVVTTCGITENILKLALSL